MSKDWNRKLLDAVVNGDCLSIKKCLENKANVNCFNETGNTPLAVAVYKKKKTVVDFLLYNGADVNAFGEPSGKTPLHWAVYKNSTALVMTLLKKNACMDYLDADGNTPLTLAIIMKKNAEIVQLLIGSGADVCRSGRNGKTPFSASVETNNLPLITHLLDKCAVLTMPTALLVAIEKGNLDVVILLEKRNVNLNYAYKNGHTPLTKAIEFGNKAIAKYLIQKGADAKALLKSSHLFKYVTDSKSEIVPFLNQLGVVVDLSGNDGDTLLSSAAKFGYINCVKELREGGASTECIQNEKEYPLLVNCVKTGNCEFVEYLIELGVNSEVPDECGYTPLTKAADMENCKMVNLLVDKGVNVNYVDGCDRNALSIAAANFSFQMVTLLIHSGANVELSRKEIDSYSSWNDDMCLFMKSSERNESC